jgi:hypothetical protein
MDGSRFNTEHLDCIGVSSAVALFTRNIGIPWKNSTIGKIFLARIHKQLVIFSDAAVRSGFRSAVCVVPAS